jgi:hypothetical protein
VYKYLKIIIYKILKLFGIERYVYLYPIFLKNIYSQNGEDGLIKYIINKIDLPKTVVDIGANDGEYCSNSKYLIDKLFFGFLIEGDLELFQKLNKLYKDNKNVKTFNYTVTIEHQESANLIWHGQFNKEVRNTISVKELIKLFPKKIGILTVDIDNNDIDITCEILRYVKPALIIVEVDSGKKENLINPINKISAFGYTIIAHTGNLFFLNNSYIHEYYYNWKLKQKIILFGKKYNL